MSGRSRSQSHRARDRLYKNPRDPRREYEPVHKTKREYLGERDMEPLPPLPTPKNVCECPCFCARMKSLCSGSCCYC